MRYKNLTSEDILELYEYTNKSKRNYKPNMKNMMNNIKEFKEAYSTRNFTCKSDNQKDIVKAINDNNTTITVVHGKPGTGKTFTAIQGVLKEFKSGDYKKIYLLKSVKTLDNKSEDIGFLKGTMEDKIAPFMFSYDFNFAQIMDKNAYTKARTEQIIEFLPLAYIRGIGLHNCLIILDEAQNVNTSILRTVLSRIGTNAKIVILGDTKQKDSSNGQSSGLNFLIKHFNDIKGIKFIEMTNEDQSRSEMINIIENRFDKLDDDGIKID